MVIHHARERQLRSPRPAAVRFTAGLGTESERERSLALSLPDAQTGGALHGTLVYVHCAYVAVEL